MHVYPGVRVLTRATEDMTVGWAWRTPLTGAVLAAVVVATGAAEAAVPSTSTAATPSPASSPTATQLKSQAQREAQVLEAEKLAQQQADLDAAAALEAYQAAQRRADEAARAAQAEADALRAAETRSAASRAALSRYLGSVYRTGVGSRQLSVLNDLIDAEDPQALFSGLSIASRVGGNRDDQLDALRRAEAQQAAAAKRAEQAEQASRTAATAAASAKTRADKAVADQRARVARAAATLAGTQQAATAAAAREKALAQAEAIARSRASSPPVDAVLGAAAARPEATCAGASLAGFANGRIPETALCPLWGTSGHMLRADAAAAFNALSRAYAVTFRAPICVTDSYRSFDEQVAVRSAKPTLAAVPGTSNHGWGVALDLCDGVQTFGSPQHVWLQQNAMAYGWFHPSWAQAGGSKPEAWHWEFAG